MQNADIFALLRDTLAYLTAPEPFPWMRRHRVLRRKLASRIRTSLTGHDETLAEHPAVGFARTRFADERVMIDPEHQIHETADAIWVRAWLRVDRDDVAPQLTPEMRDRYRQAVNALPSVTREVFLLVRIDRLTYDEIAERLGVTTSEVQDHLVAALARITLVMAAVQESPHLAVHTEGTRPHTSADDS